MLTCRVQNTCRARQERLRARLEERKLAFLLIATPCNVFYLTGFRGSAGAAVFGSRDAVLWVDPRYTLQARAEAQGVEVFEEKKPLLSAAARWLSRKGPGAAGYEDDHLSCRAFRVLEREVHRSVRLVPAGGIVEDLRIIKDEDEIEQIREAGRITVEVFEEVLPQVGVGARESDLVAEIEYRMLRKGAEGAAFETIVASGPRGALPHARASSRRLQKDELVILDLGAILGGYAADMTRTVYLGRPSQRVRRLYSAVLEAQRLATESLQAGIRAGDVDKVARRALARRGLAKYFTHSTGHGVGLEIHERPRVGRGEKTRIEAGCVVTTEPGVYLKGFGGIRIEDTVAVRPEGPEILTTAPKDDWFI